MKNKNQELSLSGFLNYLRKQAENPKCSEAFKNWVAGVVNAAVWHTGHYRTVAKASQLRFTRININLQCDECNVGKSGNIKAYRIGLVAKYGEATVQGLDNDNRIHRWTIEELEAIRAEAYAELRALKKSQEAA